MPLANSSDPWRMQNVGDNTVYLEFVCVVNYVLSSLVYFMYNVYVFHKTQIIVG